LSLGEGVGIDNGAKGNGNVSLAKAFFTERYLENLGSGKGAVCVSDAIEI